MAPHIEQIDTTVDIVTPENIAFHYRVAGPFRRAPAFLIDLIIRIGLFLAIIFFGSMILGYLNSIARGSFLIQFINAISTMLLFITFFVVEWFYGGLFESMMNGRTPGKWVMGIRVLTTDGRPINGLQAVMRNVFRAADTMPWLSLEMIGIPAPAYMVWTCMIGFVTPMMNNRYQRIGDIVCNTMVVIEERKWLAGLAKLDDPRAAQLASYIPAGFNISRSLARTLATYVERRKYFSVQRRREIAKHLGEPLVRKFGLPHDTSHDLLLCALYHRAFIADRGDDSLLLSPSPFAAGSLNPQLLPQQSMAGMTPLHIER